MSLFISALFVSLASTINQEHRTRPTSKRSHSAEKNRCRFGGIFFVVRTESEDDLRGGVLRGVCVRWVCL